MYDIALYCLKFVLFLDFRVYICKIFFYFVLEIKKIKYKEISLQVQSKTRTYVEHTAKEILRSIKEKKQTSSKIIISLIIRNIFNNDSKINYCAKSRNRAHRDWTLCKENADYIRLLLHTKVAPIP